MRVWLAKYALTQGVFPIDVEPLGGPLADDKYIPTNGKYRLYTYYKMGRDIFETRKAAVARANDMRDRKIKSLEKQLTRLRKLNF